MLISIFLATAISTSFNQAELIADNCAAKLRNAQTISGNFLLQQDEQADIAYKFRLSKPDLFEVVSTKNEFHCDGQTIWTFLPETNRYFRESKQPEEKSSAPYMLGFEPFFGIQPSFRAKEKRMDKWNDEPASAIVYVDDYNNDLSWTLFISAETYLPLGWKKHSDNPYLPNGEKNHCKTWIVLSYTNLELNNPMQAKGFSWNPPSDAQPIVRQDTQKAPDKDNK